MGESHILDDELTRDSAGLALRRAREARGLDLAEIGELTKIPERHLQTIEDGNFAALPARAYAVGFARTYARAVGLDEREVAQMVRDELDGAPEPASARPNTFDPGDPARIPSSSFAWLAAALAFAVIVAGLLFWRNYFSPAAELPPIVADQPTTSGPAAPAPAQATAGPVVFTATIPDLWVRLYDASGVRLLERSLNQGERFEVPGNVATPLLWTAHPEALTITIGGREVPRLAESQQTIKDVPVSAAALLARAKAPEPVVQAKPAALAQAAEPAPRRALAKPSARPQRASNAPAQVAAAPTEPTAPAPAEAQTTAESR